ncbi:MAG: PASTA domain-containing protein [Flavobacteriaceae bacterium]|nr:PASTA domain-containing protein [Flavobacteriaceae bacterium]
MTFFKFLLTKTFLKQLGFAVIALIALGFIVLWWLKFTTNHGQQIEVPDLAKMNLLQAEETLDDVDLKLEVLDSASYNPNFPYRTVIEQIPKAGEFVKEDRKIYIYINRSGYPMIEIPEVVGKTRRQAEPTLKSIGFEVGKITYRKYIAKDEVLELRHKGKKIQAGDKLQKTSVLDLVLGDGNGGLNRNAVEAASKELDINESKTEIEGDEGN